MAQMAFEGACTSIADQKSFLLVTRGTLDLCPKAPNSTASAEPFLLQAFDKKSQTSK